MSESPEQTTGQDADVETRQRPTDLSPMVEGRRRAEAELERQRR